MAEPYYLSERGITETEEEVFKKFNSLTNKSIELVKEIQEIDYYITERDIFRNRAWTLALDALSGIMLDVVMSTAMKAIYSTDEYNYEPYVEHFRTALMVNKNELLEVSNYGQGEFEIFDNFEILGDVSLWAQAVDAARNDMSLGKSRGQVHEETGENLATKFWREKIYGTAREGRPVIKVYKGRGRDHKGAGEKDVTEKYSGKYLETVLHRLSYLPVDKAPFWYLIENGNSEIDFASSVPNEGGYPYPLVYPTHFTFEIKRILRSFLNEMYEKYLDQVETAFLDNAAKYYDVPQVDDWNDFGVKIDDEIGKDLENVDDTSSRWERLGQRELTNELIAWDYETPKGKRTKIRDKRGRWAKAPE